MQTAETVLSIIQKRGVKRMPVERLYRQLFNHEFYLRAYAKLYRNKGALTQGVTNQTVDGMSLQRISKLVDLLRKEQFRWTPVRRTYIPKKDGSKRPLGIPCWEDKMLQEVIRMLLEAYYEPRFSDHSHGFRPKRGCHTALEEIKHTCRGTVWIIEGDISKCFDRFDHDGLIGILRRDIRDERFIRLMGGLLKAGYLEDWKWNKTLSGTPQGGVISPLLANIYLHELDTFVEEELKPQYTKGKRRRRNQMYNYCTNKRWIAKKRNDRIAYKDYDQRLRSIPSCDTHDPNYRRLRYVRYADDFLLAFVGPKSEAEAVKDQLAVFLGKKLHLELSKTKTLITHAFSERARFLGYDVTVGRSNQWRDSAGRRNLNGEILLRLPQDVLRKFCARYEQSGKPVHRNALVQESDYSIISRFQSEYRGYAQYYKLALNLHQMIKLRWIMETSMLKTLAMKYRSSVKKIADRYKCMIETEVGPMKGFRAVIERPDRNPLIAEFGGIPLRYQKRCQRITDSLYQLGFGRSELLDRLLCNQCDLCGSQEHVEVHHIRKLADLKRYKSHDAPEWVRRMTKFRRKTLVVCTSCHEAIEAGQPKSIWKDKLESRVR